jgi:hypothetical protein
MPTAKAGLNIFFMTREWAEELFDNAYYRHQFEFRWVVRIRQVQHLTAYAA